MKLEPTNRYILVKPIENNNKESDSIIVLPQDYKKPEDPHKLCEVLDISGDSKFLTSLNKEDLIIVEQRMLQKIEIDENEFYLILDNYVLGSVKNET